jgi:hypothetical protein
MSHSIFGWSYPPGCSGPPDDDEGLCEICGRTWDHCVCPECPVCEGQGDQECYFSHGLELTVEQVKGLQVVIDSEINNIMAEQSKSWDDSLEWDLTMYEEES